ncbi:hypothetical protein SAMN05660909_03973 [Chitinophaga terrae (ex Kim and Jung 2007)]|uniref:Uncharacterized protein n=1 Tax=Chitinophaga terrae (ex Kim and Jung 2007) TaxID=408074 RepID=A0A1H4EUG8_9BACT|nr:hypothetical protein [Chitinophaga terrae (ex Kim and Jung 2007)]GEP91876.1 hypothetical protein CTE07_35210 [Chitinophaga terrae (ex Kim and Jung 2007)]SEA88645.1 hypothetical protein SAMN05660909_03973 [Chitinophaga terrae (ex Kim and Jung 2007)]
MKLNETSIDRNPRYKVNDKVIYDNKPEREMCIKAIGYAKKIDLESKSVVQYFDGTYYCVWPSPDTPGEEGSSFREESLEYKGSC